MYLGMIEKKEEKEIFLKVANLVAISCCEETGDEVVAKSVSSTGSSLSSGSIITSSFSILTGTLLSGNKTVDLEGWKPSEKEMSILQQYWNELGADKEISYFSVSDIEAVIKTFAPVLEQVKSMDEVSRRKAILDKLVDDVVNWDSVAYMSPKVRKIIMIELIALALVDHNYDELERYVIELIADKLKIDSEELQEMEEFIASYMKCFDEGLEIINA